MGGRGGIFIDASTNLAIRLQVYNEFALKRNMDTSVHLQNFFLYFFGAPLVHLIANFPLAQRPVIRHRINQIHTTLPLTTPQAPAST